MFLVRLARDCSPHGARQNVEENLPTPTISFLKYSGRTLLLLLPLMLQTTTITITTTVTEASRHCGQTRRTSGFQMCRLLPGANSPASRPLKTCWQRWLEVCRRRDQDTGHYTRDYSVCCGLATKMSDKCLKMVVQYDKGLLTWSCLLLGATDRAATVQDLVCRYISPQISSPHPLSEVCWGLVATTTSVS